MKIKQNILGYLNSIILALNVGGWFKTCDGFNM
jgi:hypothetical protein